jgi:hypothetical protein
MGENGNKQASQSNGNLREQIIRALEDARYEWRTVEGVSEQIGIPTTQVQELLESLTPEIVRSSIPDEAGRSLYTTRKHYRDTHGLGAQFLAALSDKVA